MNIGDGAYAQVRAVRSKRFRIPAFAGISGQFHASLIASKERRLAFELTSLDGVVEEVGVGFQFYVGDGFG